MSGHKPRLLLLVVVIGLVQMVTLRAGHTWGDDFAHYILQAKHMAAGDGFVAREYVPNPETLNLGPQTVPPGLSVLLLPVYAVSGLNLTAMKIVLIVCLVITLVLLDGLFADRLPSGWRLALVALVGFNPVIFDMRDMIETEKPFLVFEMLALYIIDRVFRAKEKPPLWIAVALGLTLFMACATRNVGVALILTLAATVVFSLRRLAIFGVIAGGIAVLGMAVVSSLMRTGSGYSGFFNFSPLWLTRSAMVMAKTTEYLWWNGTPRLVAYGALLMAGALAAWGLWLTLRREPGPVELFLLCYTPIICAYFAPGYVFYLLPIYPFYVGYLLIGLRDFAARAPGPKVTIAAAAALACALYAIDFVRTDWGPIRQGIGDPEFRALVEFIRSHTTKSDLLLFRKPRLLALMTERPSSVYPVHLDRATSPDEVWAYIQKSNAHYLITTSILIDPDSAQMNPVLEDFSKRYGRDLTLVYNSPHYHLYRIHN